MRLRIQVGDTYSFEKEIYPPVQTIIKCIDELTPGRRVAFLNEFAQYISDNMKDLATDCSADWAMAPYYEFEQSIETYREFFNTVKEYHETRQDELLS